MHRRIIEVVMDRPIGTVHPKHPEITYPINYGYVAGLIAPDGEEQDVYLLGVTVPVDRFLGELIAVIHRTDDAEDKWVACPPGMTFTAEQIAAQVDFQEQFHQITVELIADTPSPFANRMTLTGEDGAVYVAPQWESCAAEKLAAFEEICEHVKMEEQRISDELERLRLAGQKNTAQFREQMGRKLTNSSLLRLLEERGVV